MFFTKGIPLIQTSNAVEKLTYRRITLMTYAVETRSILGRAIFSAVMATTCECLPVASVVFLVMVALQLAQEIIAVAIGHILLMEARSVFRAFPIVIYYGDLSRPRNAAMFDGRNNSIQCFYSA
jgi:hypothetical protein